MKYRFRITLINQVIALEHMFITNSIIAIIYSLFYLNSGSLILILLILFCLVTSILPTILVHVQYLSRNYNSEFLIDQLQQKCVYKENGSQFVFSFSDIEDLEHHASFGGGSYWYSFGEYRYYKITLKDKENFYITSLMHPKLKWDFERILDRQAEKKLSLIAFLPIRKFKR
jgi:hypothetical protein